MGWLEMIKITCLARITVMNGVIGITRMIWMTKNGMTGMTKDD